MTDPVRHLTTAQLAAEAGAPEQLVDRLVELGQFRPLPDGRLDAREAAIIATVQALEESGVSDDDLAWLVRHAGAGFAAVGRMFATPAPRAGPTYRELQAELGASGQRLPAVYAAFGLAEPEPDRPMRVDEASIMRRFVPSWAEVDPDGDADIRVARLSGEANRRVMEGWLDVWDATARPALATQGAPGRRQLTDPTDPNENPSIRGAEMMREMMAWLQARHLERTLNDRIINAVEGALVEAGRLPARPDLPTAIAFVDLTGYTSLTERLGDEAAALTATRLAELADACARAFGGRVVKLLGDGVLLRFDDAPTAVAAVIDLLREIVSAGLPPGHAGVAAGRVVTRDGDIYGRTVNLAARIAALAESGQLLIEEGAFVSLGDGVAVLTEIGPVALAGIGGNVALWSATIPPNDPARR